MGYRRYSIILPPFDVVWPGGLQAMKYEGGHGQMGKRLFICLEGKSMTPHQGNTILFRSSQQLPRLRLGPSKGFLS